MHHVFNGKTKKDMGGQEEYLYAIFSSIFTRQA